MRDKGTVIFWSVVVLIALGVGGFFGVRSIIRSNKIGPFKPKIESYVSLTNPGLVPGGQDPPPGKVKGRMITVDADKREIDYIYFDLPDELRAETPEDVATVVLIKWSKIEVGKYSDGRAAEIQVGLVTVVNVEDKQVVGRSIFQGADPPKSRKSSQSGSGPKPEQPIINYLKGLPRS